MRQAPLIEQLREAQPDLRRACLAMTQSAADADDLVQDTLIRALTRPPPDTQSAITPWLRTVARNLLVDRRRAYARHQRLQPTPTETSERPVVSPGSHTLLTACVSLTGKARGIVLLRGVLDLPVSDAADMLSVTQSNAKVLYHRARQNLVDMPPPDRTRVAAWYEQLLNLELSTLSDLVRWQVPEPAVPLYLGRAGTTAWWSLHTQGLQVLGATPDRARATGLWCLGLSLMERQEPKRSVHVLTEAMEIANEGGHHDIIGHVKPILEYQRISWDAAYEPQSDIRLHVGVSWRTGDLQAALEALQDKTLSDQQLPGVIQHNTAMISALAGDIERALDAGQAALATHLECGDRRGEARARNAIGMALQNRGQLEESERWFQKALTQFQQLGAHASAGKTYNNLGLLCHERGHYGRAESLFHRAKRLAIERRSELIALANLGVAQRARAHRSAPVTLRSVADRAHQAGLPQLHAFCLAHLGACIATTDLPAAQAVHEQARQLLEPLRAVRLLEVLAACQASVGLHHTPPALGPAQDTLAALSHGSEQAPVPPAARHAAVRIATSMLAVDLATHLAKSD